MGLDTASEVLRLWAVTRGENTGIGLTYLAPALPERVLRDGFTVAACAERAQGRDPELDQIALAGSAEELTGLVGLRADYLEPVVRCTRGHPFGATPDSAAGEEVAGAFVEFGRAPQAAGPEAGQVAPRATDGLAGADGTNALHVVDPSVPGGAHLLDAAALEVPLGAGDQVERRSRPGWAEAARAYCSAAAR
jgi:hypothetical protein